MNRSGFTLVEVMIATFIASIVALLLFAALSQLTRFIPQLDSLTDIYEKAAIVNAQLERDLSGITAPNEFYVRQKKAAKAKPSKNQNENKNQPAATTEEPKEYKPLEKVFYSTNKEGMLNQLSFITTNPLQVYWSAKAGSAKPRVARVLYTLKEDPKANKNAKKSYSLVRKESPNMEFDAILKTGKDAPQEYVIADGIQSFKVEYTSVIPEEQKKEEGTQKAAPQAQNKNIKKSTDWAGAAEEVQAQPAGQSKENAPLVPNLIAVQGSFWDTKKKRSVPFAFEIMIRSEIETKRKAENVNDQILGTLRGFYDQAFAPQNKSPQQFAQTNTPTKITVRR